MAISSTAGRIGPNAIIQTVAALSERRGAAGARAVLELAGHAELLRDLPGEMVAEREFRALALALAGQVGAAEAGDLLERAGALTAAYLLRARIPPPAQWALRMLPPRPALRLLLAAVAKNAHTFGESGAFSYALGDAPAITIANRALCDTPAAGALVCRFYRGTFTALLRALVSPTAELRERACQGRGDQACVYEVDLRARG